MIIYVIISSNPYGPFYQYEMTLISACISNYIHCTLSDEIFVHSKLFEIWGIDMYFHPSDCIGYNYLSMLGLKLNHDNKRGPTIKGVYDFLIGLLLWKMTHW